MANPTAAALKGVRAVRLPRRVSRNARGRARLLAHPV
jgi:hypothetical protein